MAKSRNRNSINDHSMYNFAEPKLLPKVTASAPCMDNYEVTNLINVNPLIRSRGFLTFTSIKPPVDVDFEFMCNVSLQYVTIDATVGTQRTRGCEIYASTGNTEFTAISGKIFFDEKGIIFFNPRYYSNTSPPENVEPQFHLASFKGHQFRTFINAKRFRIRILSTERSVPCLGKVAIYGRISKSCSKSLSDSIRRIMRPKVTTNSAGSIPASPSCELKPDFNIPDDFKDELTFEVMALPMTLPSGHTIDKSTLEKCINHDATYYRRPTDPFTGLEFTAALKPTLNVALKARIDMFLIQNAQRPETFTITRTSGTLNDPKARTNLKRKQVDEIDSNLLNAVSDPTRIDSFELAIAEALKDRNFIHFTENKNEDEVDTVDTKCSNKSCDTIDNLYQLVCNHLYCRTCLLRMYKTETCSVCMHKFKRNDVNRYHVVNFK